jgi:hypothetical protein
MKPITEFYMKAWDAVTKAGYADEAEWVRNLKPIEDQTYDAFIHEYVWVVLNANMWEQAARKVYDKFWECVEEKHQQVLVHEGQNPFLVIRHPNKRNAIMKVLPNGSKIFKGLQEAEDKIAYIATLPYMGQALRHHLARNLGIDTVKPDRHMIRLAERFGYASPLEMCKDIQDDLYPTKEKLGVIDVILWRYCNLGGCEKP